MLLSGSGAISIQLPRFPFSLNTRLVVCPLSCACRFWRFKSKRYLLRFWVPKLIIAVRRDWNLLNCSFQWQSSCPTLLSKIPTSVDDLKPEGICHRLGIRWSGLRGGMKLPYPFSICPAEIETCANQNRYLVYQKLISGLSGGEKRFGSAFHIQNPRYNKLHVLTLAGPQITNLCNRSLLTVMCINTCLYLFIIIVQVFYE